MAINATRPLTFVDSLSLQNPIDTVLLDELVIEGIGEKALIKNLDNGAIQIKSSSISDMPSILGGGDVLSALRSMGVVSTASDLNSSFSVHGLPTGSTLYSSNGIRLGNPLHLLGLYSSYVPGLFDRYLLETFPDVALSDNTAAAVLDAASDTRPDSAFSGAATIGLIESHANVNIPISKSRPTSISLAIRKSYLNQVFPDLLKAGSSVLGYSFVDGGLILKSRMSAKDYLSVSFIASRDNLSMKNSLYGYKESRAGWGNISGGIAFGHSNLKVGADISYFKNYFEIEEGMHSIKLPSSFSDISLFCDYRLPLDIRLHIDAHRRDVSGQKNKSVAGEEDEAPGKSKAWEVNAAVGWRKRFLDILNVDLGVRLCAYHSRFYSQSFSHFYPQPRVALTLSLPWESKIALRYARLMRFDRLLEESSSGMPINFFINSSSALPPEDNHSLELDLSGRIPLFLLDWRITGYYIRMLAAAEYGGGLLNFTSPKYDPLSDLHFGKGYSAGLTLSLSRQFGNVRGRLNYNLGKSRVRIPFFSNSYIPSYSDRTHDFSASLTWQFLKHFILSGTFTYATGTPFTMAKYGYIIGENLICEYYPHNSSRLPPYKRLDLSFTYQLKSRHLLHEFNLSVYNALASRNMLFMYNSYSLKDGVEVKKAVMKSVIPSVAYAIKF